MILRKEIELLCRRFDVSILYYSRVGVKCINQLPDSDMFKHHATGDVFSVEASDLHLSTDRLKDRYTLLGRPVTQSPHYDLMQKLEKGIDIRESEYMKRLVVGALDARDPVKIGQAFIELMHRKFEEEYERLKTGECEPVKVAKVGGRLYISDGKHRAALCALLGLAPRCVDVSTVVLDSFNWWVYRKMLKKPSQFTKHIEFYRAVGMKE